MFGSDEIKAVEERVKEMFAMILKLEDRVGKLESGQSALGDDAEKLEGKVEALDGKQQGSAKDIAGIQKKIQTLDTKIAALRKAK